MSLGAFAVIGDPSCNSPTPFLDKHNGPFDAGVPWFEFAYTLRPEIPQRRLRMFSHIMIGSNDIERSKRFYDAVLGVLGVKPATINKNATGHTRLFYRHDGNTFCVTEPINGQPATPANGGTIGFKCDSEEQARAFHDAAVANGGTSIEDPPGYREGSLGKTYFAYVRDPDGHKLCTLYRPSNG
jgi:catechol 2,3-dioxygenase-like lactoylglutathione lyase family enzyme